MARSVLAQWRRQRQHNEAGNVGIMAVSIHTPARATLHVPSEAHIIVRTQYCVGAGTMAQ